MKPPLTAPGGQGSRLLPDDVLEEVIGGAGVVSPARLEMLLRSGGAPQAAPGQAG